MDRTFSIISHRREWVFNIPKDARHLFTSDTHYDHGNIIRYSSRPFLNKEEQVRFANKEKFKPCQDSINWMNREIVNRINEVARPQDILWHLGDVAWHGKRMAAEFFRNLNCKNIILVWGNHDEPDFADLIPLQKASPRYDKTLADEQSILPCYDQLFAIIDGQKVHMNHYPNDTWEESHKGMWHFYGHVHGAKNNRHRECAGWALSLDVGVDSHNFYPWTMEELRALTAKRRPDWEAYRNKWKDKEDGGMTPVSKIS